MTVLGHQFSRFKLKHKIFGGFLAVGVMAMVIAAVSVVTINNLYGNFQRFTAFGSQVEAGRELSAEMIELQRLSEQYMREGQGFAADRASYAFDRANELLSTLEQGREPDILVRTGVIRLHLEAFQQAFTEVRRQRGRQHRLVDETIREHAEQTQSLTFYYQDHLPNNHLSQVATAEKLENALLQVERNSYRYFDNFDSALVRRIKVDIVHARSLLAMLKRQEDHTRQTVLLQQIDTALENYQSVILEAVQLTRGYLYLVNVVMAAETYEILYQSARLSETLKSEMGRIEFQMSETIRRASTRALLAGLTTLLLLVVLSYVIGRSIASPIEALTATFRKLANGESEIPPIPKSSNDELSDLARAARVFGDKNRETERLLAQYQSISEELEERVDARTRDLEAANHQLERLSRTDGLTGLANRRYFEEVMEREWATSTRSDLCLAVIMVDVDLFKPFNDIYGHQEGDECLRAVANSLTDALSRKTDLVARYGGEEFILILQDMDQKAAQAMGERLRKAIVDRNIPHDGSPFGIVTASFGVAVHLPGDTIASGEALIRIADSALYRSKQDGRNRVTCLTDGRDPCPT